MDLFNKPQMDFKSTLTHGVQKETDVFYKSRPLYQTPFISSDLSLPHRSLRFWTYLFSGGGASGGGEGVE